MARRRQIYEGKAKILYEGPEPGTLIQYFKDDATAFNAQKRGTISGKGVINNRISEHIFTALATIGVPTHFIRRINMREQLIRQVEIIPSKVKMCSEIRLLSTPLPLIVPFFCALNAVASSLKYWISVPGSGPS